MIRGNEWMRNLRNKGTTYSWFTRSNGFSTGQECSIGIPGARCVDRAAKTPSVHDIHEILIRYALTRPFRGHSGSNSCKRTRWLPRVMVMQQPKKKDDRRLLTFLIVCNLNGELLPSLQTRIKTGRVSPTCG